MESPSTPLASPPTSDAAEGKQAAPANLRGFLKKQGPGFSSKWQLRWFEQKGDRLYYYKPSSLSFSISAGETDDADPDDDVNSGSNPSSPSARSPSPTRSTSGRFRKGGDVMVVSSGRGMKDVTEAASATASSDKKKDKKDKRDKTKSNRDDAMMESSGAGSEGDGGGNDGNDDDDLPPMPNPRGFIELRRVSAIAGRANDINAAKNLEKYHFYFDLYTAERVFRLAASTEENYLYWNEGLRQWKWHMSSLLPPLQFKAQTSTSLGIPSSFLASKGSSSSASTSSSSSSSSSSPALSSSPSPLSAGLLTLSPNSPLYSPFSLALPPQASSSPSSVASPAAMRFADVDRADPRDESDWTRRSTKWGHTALREDRTPPTRRLGGSRTQEDLKQLRSGRSVRSTRDLMRTPQQQSVSPSANTLPADDRDRELLLEREKGLQELLALKDQEIAQLKEDLERERRSAGGEARSSSSESVLTQRKANFLGSRSGGHLTSSVDSSGVGDAQASGRWTSGGGPVSELARRLADELVQERSESLRSRINAKEAELALKQELLEREMEIKHLHFVIDDMEKQQQQQQQQQEAEYSNSGEQIDAIVAVNGSDEEIKAAVDDVDRLSLDSGGGGGAQPSAAATAAAAAMVAGGGKDARDWGRESKRRDKKEEKEEREREKRELKEQREREKKEGNAAGGKARKKESKQFVEEARRQLEQERKEHRLASNFLRSQCELLEAQKVAAEEHFAQLRLALEKEINEARAKCHELERLRLAETDKEGASGRLGPSRHQTGPAALANRMSADAGAE